MLGTVLASGCSTAQPGLDGNRGARSGGFFEVQWQLGATANSENVLGQVSVEASRPVCNDDKSLLSEAVKSVGTSGELTAKGGATTPYDRKDLIA